MPYSIREGVRDSERRLKAEREILERYPDATLETLPDGKTSAWVSEAVEATSFTIVVPNQDTAFGSTIYFCPYTEIEEMKIFTKHWRWKSVFEVLHALKIRNEPLHTALLAEILR